MAVLLLIWRRKIQYDIGTMYDIKEVHVSRYLHDKLCTIRNRCAISSESEPSILIAHAKQSLSCKIRLSCKYTLHILYRYVQCTANLYLYMVRYLHDREIYVLRVKGERALVLKAVPPRARRARSSRNYAYLGTAVPE